MDRPAIFAGVLHRLRRFAVNTVIEVFEKLGIAFDGLLNCCDVHLLLQCIDRLATLRSEPLQRCVEDSAKVTAAFGSAVRVARLSRLERDQVLCSSSVTFLFFRWTTSVTSTVFVTCHRC